MIRTACTLAFALSCLTTMARAEDCGPLKQISSLDMMALPGGRYTVPVTINGTQQQMLLATAGGITTLRQDAAATMGLQADRRQPHQAARPANGNVSQNYVQVDFALGRLQDPRLQLIVMPPDGGNARRLSGNLAGDFLSLNDVEMDFAGRKLNVFSKDHCAGHVLYWNPTAVAVLPITLPDSRLPNHPQRLHPLFLSRQSHHRAGDD